MKLVSNKSEVEEVISSTDDAYLSEELSTLDTSNLKKIPAEKDSFSTNLVQRLESNEDMEKIKINSMSDKTEQNTDGIYVWTEVNDVKDKEDHIQRDVNDVRPDKGVNGIVYDLKMMSLINNNVSDGGNSSQNLEDVCQSNEVIFAMGKLALNTFDIETEGNIKVDKERERKIQTNIDKEGNIPVDKERKVQTDKVKERKVRVDKERKGEMTSNKAKEGKVPINNEGERNLAVDTVKEEKVATGKRKEVNVLVNKENKGKVLPIRKEIDEREITAYKNNKECNMGKDEKEIKLKLITNRSERKPEENEEQVEPVPRGPTGGRVNNNYRNQTMDYYYTSAEFCSGLEQQPNKYYRPLETELNYCAEADDTFVKSIICNPTVFNGQIRSGLNENNFTAFNGLSTDPNMCMGGLCMPSQFSNTDTLPDLGSLDGFPDLLTCFSDSLLSLPQSIMGQNPCSCPVLTEPSAIDVSQYTPLVGPVTLGPSSTGGITLVRSYPIQNPPDGLQNCYSPGEVISQLMVTTAFASESQMMDGRFSQTSSCCSSQNQIFPVYSSKNQFVSVCPSQKINLTSVVPSPPSVSSLAAGSPSSQVLMDAGDQDLLMTTFSPDQLSYGLHSPDSGWSSGYEEGLELAMEVIQSDRSLQELERNSSKTLCIQEPNDSLTVGLTSVCMSTLPQSVVDSIILDSEPSVTSTSKNGFNFGKISSQNGKAVGSNRVPNTKRARDKTNKRKNTEQRPLEIVVNAPVNMTHSPTAGRILPSVTLFSCIPPAITVSQSNSCDTVQIPHVLIDSLDSQQQQAKSNKQRLRKIQPKQQEHFAPTTVVPFQTSVFTTLLQRFSPPSFILPSSSESNSAMETIEGDRRMAKAYRTVAAFTQEQLMEVDDDGDTIFHVAIVREDLEEVKLVKAFIDRYKRDKLIDRIINLSNKQHQTPLCLAVFTNLSEVVKMLIAENADVNFQLQKRLNDGSVKLYRLIHFAASRGQKWIHTLNQLLTSNRIELHAFNSEGCTPLHCAIEWHGRKGQHGTEITDSKATIYQLAMRGADLNIAHGCSGKTPLHYCIEKKNKELIGWYLELASYIQSMKSNNLLHEIVNAKTSSGMTTLQLAASCFQLDSSDRVDILELLLKSGAEIKTTELRRELAKIPQLGPWRKK